MNEKERLLGVLRGEAIPEVPCICPGGMMNAIVVDLMDRCGIAWPEAHTDPAMMAELARAVYDHEMFENYGVPFCMTVEAETLGAPVDMGNRECEPHVSGYIIGGVERWVELPEPDLGRGRARVVIEAIERLKRTGKEGVPIIGNLTGPLSLATSLADPIDFYKSLRRKNEDAHALMRRVTDMLTAFGTAQAAAGADVLAISDPSGTGEILGARYFREFAVRYLNELIRGVRHTFPDMRFIVHICGQMKNVFSELSAVEADAFSFDAMVNLRTAREHLAPRKVMGNVSSFGLAFASEEKVQAMARAALNMGSDILAPACGLGTRSDIRSIQALLRAARRNREEEEALLCTI